MERHIPRKQFGQHFLHEKGAIHRMIETFSPLQGESVVEIGPGKGALTSRLLERVSVLDVIEIDEDLVRYLMSHYPNQDQLHIHQADALRFDFSTLAQAGQKLRLIGNLPYNISTPLLFHLLSYKTHIQDMLFMLQKEVAERLTAKPGGKTYGRLSVMVQRHCEVDKIFTLKPGAFTPAPKVDSCVVHLIPHTRYSLAVSDEGAFSRLVSQAFSNRRKTLRNNLKGAIDEAAIQNAGIDPNARAETLSLEQLLNLYTSLN